MKVEPPRVRRRPFGLSSRRHGRLFQHGVAGGMLPMGSKSRRLLNQSTHSSVANSTASNDRHGPRR